MHICLTTWNRYEYLERSLPSLLRTDFPEGTHLVISDDCSTDERVQQLIRGIIPPKNVTLEIIWRERNRGCAGNILTTAKNCAEQSNSNEIILVDSDALYNPEWMRKLIEAWESVKDDNTAEVSVFNVTETHPILWEHKGLFEKDHLGGFCCIVRWDILEKISLKTLTWDWDYIALCKSCGLRFFCTKKSYVQHIGAVGNSSNGRQHYDEAHDFVGE